jgi:hypothetical protein
VLEVERDFAALAFKPGLVPELDGQLVAMSPSLSLFDVLTVPRVEREPRRELEQHGAERAALRAVRKQHPEAEHAQRRCRQVCAARGAARASTEPHLPAIAPTGAL